MKFEYWIAMGKLRVATVAECRSVLAEVGSAMVKALQAAELSATGSLGATGVQVQVSGSQGNCVWRVPEGTGYKCWNTEFLPDEWVLCIAGGLPGIASAFTAFLKAEEDRANDALKEASKVL